MPTVPVWAAFGAGLLSLLSPCVLALLPAYVGYLGGVGGRFSVGESATPRGTLLLHAVLFVLGFSLVFIAFGASASVLGQALLRYQDVVQKVAGALVIAFGLHTLGVLPLPFLERGYQWRINTSGGRSGRWNALVIGMAFGGGWAPCVGPILGSILMLAAAGETLASGVMLLGAYSLGMAIPFLAFALFLDRAQGVIRFFRSRHRVVSLFSGVMLIALGVMLFTDLFTRLAQYAGYYYYLFDVW